jgi:hypothetical protein
MKGKLMLMAAVILSLALLGCKTTTVPGGKVTPEGTVVFSATGSSIVAREDDALALLEARTAAETIAEAELLKKVKGAFINSKVTVGDLMFSSQEASTHVEGYLSRAEISYTKQEPEGQVVTATATLELSRKELDSLARYVE